LLAYAATSRQLLRERAAVRQATVERDGDLAAECLERL
jgi:hypothetical protein